MRFYLPLGQTQWKGNGQLYQADHHGVIDVLDINDIALATAAGLTILDEDNGWLGNRATAPYFGRIWPDFQLVTNHGDSNVILDGWNNVVGNHSVTVNSGPQTMKVPSNSKGIIMNVESILNGVGTAGALLGQHLTIYADSGFTQVADYFQHHGRDAGGTVGADQGTAFFKLFMPIINGKIYYNVAIIGSTTGANFDFFVAGIWD